MLFRSRMIEKIRIVKLFFVTTFGWLRWHKRHAKCHRVTLRVHINGSKRQERSFAPALNDNSQERCRSAYDDTVNNPRANKQSRGAAKKNPRPAYR
jgi:hypothetical protein